MKKIIMASLFLFVTSSALAGEYTIRKNNFIGQPDRTQKGMVVEEQPDGTMVIREETFPGSKRGNRFEKGQVVEEQYDGSLIIREEFLPGSGTPNRFDRGYTIEEN